MVSALAYSTAVTALTVVSTSMQRRNPPSFFFFFNDTAPPEFYPLSLHDALPIPHVVGQKIGRLREVPPQVLLAERVAHQQLPARRAQCNGPLLADIDLAEQPQEILHTQRHHHRACKLALGVRIAPADGDHPFARGAAADRRPDVDA